LPQNTFMLIWPVDEKKNHMPAKGPVRVARNAYVTLGTGWGNGADLQLLEKLKSDDIQSLNVEGSIVNQDSLKYICAVKGLKKLSLSGTWIGDNEIAMVVDCLPQLRELDVSYTQVTDKSIDSILKLKQLNTLILRKGLITNAGLARLASIGSLNGLDLKEMPITDASLKSVGTIKSLTTLNLSSTKITNEGVRYLTGLHSLKMIDLSNTAVGDAGLTELGKISSIEELNLSKTQVGDRGLSKLRGLVHLRKLWIRDLAKVTDASIPTIVSHTELKDIELQKTSITAKGVLALARALPLSEVHSKSFCRCRKRTRVN
jgi:internalin A